MSLRVILFPWLLCCLSVMAQNDGKTVEGYLERAQRSLQAEQPEMALEFVDYALQLDSNSHEALMQRVRICSMLRRYEEAVDGCIRLKALAGEKPVELYTRWCNIYMNMNNAEAARDIVEEGLSLHPESFALIYNKAHVLMSLKEYAKAYACYERAFRMDPLADGPPFLLGMRADGQGHLAEALLYYLQNLMVDPQGEAAAFIMRQFSSWLQRETLPETASHEDFLILEAMRELSSEPTPFGQPFAIVNKSLEVVLRDMLPREEGYEVKNFYRTDDPLNETCRRLYADMRSKGLLTAFLHNAAVTSGGGRNAEWLKTHHDEVMRVAEYMQTATSKFEKEPAQ